MNKTPENRSSNTVQQKPTVQHVLYIYYIFYYIIYYTIYQPFILFILIERKFICWNVGTLDGFFRFFLSIRAFFSLGFFFIVGGMGDVKNKRKQRRVCLQ